MSSEEFQKLFKESGGRLSSKGRPVINPEVLDRELPLRNRKVLNATKVFSDTGELLADSKWEYKCKTIIEESGLEMDFQRTFELLPTLRRKGQRTLKKRTWTPDFTFESQKIVADAKGHITEVAKLKIHLFLFLYPGWEAVLLRNKDEVYNFVHKLKSKQNNEES